MEPDGETDFGPKVEAVLDDLERVGGSEACPPELARLARFVSGLVKVLVRKRLVTEGEVAAAFVQAERGAPKR
jgi:hypothetical protein